MLKLLTVKEVAEILKVSYETALNFVKYSGITYINVGKQYRVSEKDFENYIKIKKR